MEMEVLETIVRVFRIFTGLLLMLSAEIMPELKWIGIMLMIDGIISIVGWDTLRKLVKRK